MWRWDEGRPGGAIGVLSFVITTMPGAGLETSGRAVASGRRQWWRRTPLSVPRERVMR